MIKFTGVKSAQYEIRASFNQTLEAGNTSPATLKFEMKIASGSIVHFLEKRDTAIYLLKGEQALFKLGGE